jgi:hypothetical protein
MDPLTLRELQGLSRRRVVYLTRVVYVGLFGLALYVWWFAERNRLRILSASDLAYLGRQLFHSLVLLQICLVGAGAAVGGADMLLKEVRTRTLAIVVATPLSGVAIVWAKWKAAMIQAAALLLCSLPALSMCVYLGAIGPWELAWSITLTLGIASISAALGLRHALRCKTTAGATFRAVFEFVLPPVILAAFGGFLPFAQEALVFLHPLGALLGIINPRLFGGQGQYGWISATLVSLLVSAWLIRRTGRSVVEFGSRIEEPDPDLTEDRGLLVAGAAVRSWVTELRVWDDQPLLWKELATRPGVRLEFLLGKPLLWATFLLLVLMWLATDGASVEFLAVVEAAVLASVVLIGSGLFTRDRETRWNEMLLCTPLSDVELLRAKLFGGLVSPESVYMLGLGLVVLLGWSLPSGILPAILSLFTSALFLLDAYLLAALASLLSRTMRGAFLFAGAVIVLLLLAAPDQSVWEEWRMLFGGEQEWGLRNWFSSLSPISFLHSTGRRSDHLADKPFQAALCFAAVYGAASLALLGGLSWTFHRQRSRR